MKVTLEQVQSTLEDNIARNEAAPAPLTEAQIAVIVEQILALDIPRLKDVLKGIRLPENLLFIILEPELTPLWKSTI